MKELIKENEQLICSAPGCTKNRHSLSSYCGAHYIKKLYFGDIRGRKIRYNETDLERAQARHVIEANPKHPAIEQCIEFFTTRLENAANDVPGVPCKKQFARMHSEGVTGKDLAIEAIAILLFHYHNPGTIPDDTPGPFQIALALAVACFKRREKIGIRHIAHTRISAQERKVLGKSIWNELGKALTIIASEIQSYERAKEKQIQYGRLIVRY
jgi:hypothetical protein